MTASEPSNRSARGATDITSVVRDGLHKSLASLLIKVATAGLTYFMFVVLSRTLGDAPYGQFAFGFSLATMLAIGASMGQQTAILRYWPEDMGAGDEAGAQNALRSGWALTLIAGVVLAGVLCLVALVLGLVASDFSSVTHLFAAALLILPLAAAEYGSSALRAQGSVWTALLPRDIIWRSLVPGLVWFLFITGTQLDGAQALVLTAAMLGLALVMQSLAARWRHYRNSAGLRGLPGYLKKRGGATRWFMAGTVLDSAALNFDIVLVGLMVAVEAAGIYFNAFRTAGLLTLFMFAITLVIAPMVAKHYHAGEMRRAQAITTFCAWAGFAFSVVVFIGFVIFGDLILSLFGATYTEGYWVLILLSVGLLMDAATGPTRIVMMMTGHERQYVSIFGSITLVGFVVMLVTVPFFGIVGAALVNAISRIIAQTAIAWWTHKHVGIDTSLFGLRHLIGHRAAAAQ